MNAIIDASIQSDFDRLYGDLCNEIYDENFDNMQLQWEEAPTMWDSGEPIPNQPFQPEFGNSPGSWSVPVSFDT